jgi:hypothetical protein
MKINKNRVFSRLVELFADAYIDVATDDKTLRIDGGIIAVDAKISAVVNDETTDLEDGTYILTQEGKSIVVVGGVITEITDIVADTTDVVTETEDVVDPVVDENMKFSVIKQISKWEMTVDNNTFVVGSKVTASYEDGESYAIYAGTYELEDGRLITLDGDGVIVLITDAKGVVLETPVVDEVVAEDTVPMEVMSALERADVTVKNLTAKYNALMEKFEALSKEPATTHTTEKFEIVNNKPKSALHAMLNK